MPRLHGFWYIRINCFSTKAPGKIHAYFRSNRMNSRLDRHSSMG